MNRDAMRERFIATTAMLLDEDPRVAVVLADISHAKFIAIAGKHRERVFNVGIREQLMIGVCSGLALTGMIPVAHSYSSFLVDRTYEQIKVDLAHQDVPVVLVGIGGSYDAAVEGRTHQSPGDVALLDTLGDWTVDIPGHPDEIPTLVREAIARWRRTYIRLSARTNARPAKLDGRLQVVQWGTRGSVVAVGPLLDIVLEAVDGLDLTVLHAIRVRPFDGSTLAATLAGGDVVLVEPYLAGASSAFVHRALANVPHRCLTLGVGDTDLRRYGTSEEHEHAHGLDVPGIRRSVQEFLLSNVSIGTRRGEGR